MADVETIVDKCELHRCSLGKRPSSQCPTVSTGNSTAAAGVEVLPLGGVGRGHGRTDRTAGERLEKRRFDELERAARLRLERGDLLLEIRPARPSLAEVPLADLSLGRCSR